MLEYANLVTRSEFDSWCEKRPGYAIASYPANKILTTEDVVNNYFATCSIPTTATDPADGLTKKTVPRFDQISRISIHKIHVYNGDTVSRTFRIAYWVHGTSEDAAADTTDYFTVPAETTVEVKIYNLTLLEKYDLRLDVQQPVQIPEQPHYIIIGSWRIDAAGHISSANNATSCRSNYGTILIDTGEQVFSNVVFMSFWNGQLILLDS